MKSWIAVAALLCAGFVCAEEPKPDYSQEPWVVEQWHVHMRFDADGLSRREVEARIKVQTQSGVERLGRVAIAYSGANERPEIEYVRVRKPDGSVISASLDAAIDLTAPVARDAPVYTDARQKHVLVRSLRPGDILEYRFAIVVHTPVAPGEFWAEYAFHGGGIMLDEQLDIDVPRERAVKLKTKPGLEPEIKESGDRRIYRWKTAKLEREPEPDATKKPKRKEPEAPDVQMTTFAGWDEVGRWYRSLEGPRREPTPEIRAKAAELVRGRTTDLGKIEALYDFVAKNYRYISLSFGLGRYQPHSAAEVLGNQYGDCKDKHALLAALLEAVGLHANAVLINSARKLDPEVPSPAQFDHVFTLVPVGTDPVWLDTTTEVAPFRLLSHNLRDKQALVIGDTGAKLAFTPADPPFPSRKTLEVEGTISEIGKLRAHFVQTARGDDELGMRSTFRRVPQANWNRLVQSSGAQRDVSNVKISDPAATKEAFRAEYDIAQANVFDWTQKQAHFPLTLGSIALADPGEADDAAEDIRLGAPGETLIRIKLQLPSRYTVRLPLPVAVTRDYAEFRSEYSMQGQTLTVARKYVLRQRQIPSSRRQDYLAFRRTVIGDYQQQLALESAAAGDSSKLAANMKGEELYEAALAALSGGKFQGAAEILKRVVQADPHHGSAWGMLGRAYLGMERADRAVEAFRKQIEANPYEEHAYANLGRALQLQRNYNEAAAAYNKQLEFSPLDQFAHSGLGDLYLETQKYAEAAAHLEKALALRPNDPTLLVSAGRAYLNLGQTEKALAAYDHAVRQSPSPRTWNNIAYQLASKKIEMERAQRYAESAVATTSAQLRNLTGEQVDEAHVALTRSLAASWDTLGWVHFQQGGLDLAEKFITASWSLSESGEVADHLGRIYEARGQKDRAVQMYALALAAERPSNDARAHLAAVLGEAKPEVAVERARTERARLRRVELGTVLKSDANAEFLLLLSSEAKVEEARYLTGSDKLRPAADALRAAKYNISFPDATPTRVVLRGTVACSAKTGCSFQMLPGTGAGE